MPVATTRAHARLLARRALREVIGGLLSLPAEQVALLDGPHGPVLLGAAREIGISLSYAGDWALIGLSEGRALGVDIVKIDCLPEIESLARGYLPVAVCRGVLAAPPDRRDACFAQGWAEMEASSKCLGLPLQEIDAEREQALQACALLPCAQLDGYRIAAAVRLPAGVGWPSG
ncbi:MAG: hypothetical protein ABFE02_17290 [Sulfuricella sp.]